MARKRERAFAGFFAVLFLLTSSALTIAVIVSNSQNSSSNNSSSDASSSTDSSSSSSTSKLAGTKLANFNPVATVPTLQTTDITPGTGAVAKAGDTVTVNYTGAVASTGVIFQSSLDTGQPATLSLNNVIKGWQLGIPGMKVGGTRQLLIPASEAYGANPPSGSGIPANAGLVFNVTLEKVD